MFLENRLLLDYWKIRWISWTIQQLALDTMMSQSLTLSQRLLISIRVASFPKLKEIEPSPLISTSPCFTCCLSGFNRLVSKDGKSILDTTDFVSATGLLRTVWDFKVVAWEILETWFDENILERGLSSFKKNGWRNNREADGRLVGSFWSRR